MGPSLLRYTFAFTLAASLIGQTPAKRPLKLDHPARFHDVGAPEVSPDGKWIAYTVSSIDKDADKRDSDLWMVSLDGTQTVQLTSSPESEASPRSEEHTSELPVTFLYLV